MNNLIRLMILNMLVIQAAPLFAQTGPQGGRPDTEILTLQQAVQMTLLRAPEIALAQAQTNRAGEALRETRSLDMPQVLAGTGLAYNNGFPLSIEGAAPSIVQVGVSKSFLNRRNKALILEAEESIKASQLGSDAARNELAARTALAYCEMHQARKAASLWTSRLETARTEEAAVAALLEGGRAKPVDLTLARTIARGTQQQLLVTQEQARLAETELRELTGLPGSTAIRTQDPHFKTDLFALPSEILYQKALEMHPEIRQAEINLRAREFHVEAEKAENYPRLELVSQYALFSRVNNYQDYFNRFSRHNFLVGLSVQVPIFNGFRTSARVAQSKQEAAEARFRLQRAKSELKLGIERTTSALRIAQGAADLANGEVDAARESEQVSESLFEAGRISSKDLAQAHNQVREKELLLMEAERVVYQRHIELLRLIGALATTD